MIDEPDVKKIEVNQERHSEGPFKGLPKKIDYPLTEDGRIDWYKVIPKKFVVANKDRTTEVDVNKLKPEDTLILLEGFLHLADLHGYSSNLRDITNIVTVPNGYITSATASSYITWSATGYNGDKETVTSEIGNANLEITKDVFQNFIPEIAGNHAFVRNCRNYFRLKAYGRDEVAQEGSSRRAISAILSGIPIEQLNDKEKSVEIKKHISGFDPHDILEKRLKKHRINWERFVNQMNVKGFVESENWKGVTDVPAEKIPDILEIIEARVKELAEQQAKRQEKEEKAKAIEALNPSDEWTGE